MTAVSITDYNGIAIPYLFGLGVSVPELAEWAGLTTPDILRILESAGLVDMESVDA